MNKIDDKKIIKALMTYGTISGTADYLGCTTEMLSERLEDKEFANMYRDRLYGYLEDEGLMVLRVAALNSLINIINNKEASTTERIQAADILLKHTQIKYT